MLKHYDFYRSMGMLPLNIDKDIEALNKIWKGER